MFQRKVTLLEGIHPSAEQYYGDWGYHVESYKSASQGDELSKFLKSSQIVGIRSNTQLTEEAIKNSILEVIGCYCIGTNQVNLDEASKHGVVVFNDPISNGRSVVELALAMMFSLARKLTEKSLQMHHGEWNKSAEGAIEMRGKTIGIIGYGNIGKQLGKACSSLGMNVLYYDTMSQPNDLYAKSASLDELLMGSDVISLHVPGEGTKNLINKDQISKMKPGSYILNLSRGHVVNQQDLSEALDSKHIAGAGFDVYSSEPKTNGSGFINPLLGRSNTILTPHIGGSTAEAQEAIGKYVSSKVIEYDKTGSTIGSVNLPEIQLSPKDSGHIRYGIIHLNTPGIIGKIGDTLGEYNLNIEQQTNKHRGDIAYTLVDVSGTAPILSNLQNIEGVIRARQY